MSFRCVYEEDCIKFYRTNGNERTRNLEERIRPDEIKLRAKVAIANNALCPEKNVCCLPKKIFR